MDDAIKMLEDEILALGIPREGSAGWYILRAKSLGLSFLKTVKQRGIVDPLAADSFRKDLRMALIAPDAPVNAASVSA